MLRASAIIALLLVAAPAFAQGLRTGEYRQAYCELYEHRDMQGRRLRIANGDRVSFNNPGRVSSNAWSYRPSRNDSISSAYVPPRCTLRIWEHAEGQGRSAEWHGRDTGWNVSYFGGQWNDRISSVACICR
ncbi:peptidase inhibitor family I36 protein [Sabulicella rubraurantiaca]|uniref:peptidase inhibitor family I36 protein n=1 Tax=Sabulicella rubraurantiaca TaxID=2811429 RepID=UPI001A97CA29|nr:peptidase inhibitor family I36 protein [Sabulicella rubraurantiaca]